MGFHVGPRVLRATGGSIDHKDGYRIHHFPPKITERGLLFNLDFGDKRCEPGYNNGSTDVFGDISGNGRNFTRSGGFPFTSMAGGVRQFDGSNDYIYRTDTSLFTIGSKFTIEFNFRMGTNNTRMGLVSSHASLGGSNQDAIEIEIDTNNRLMTGYRRNPGAAFSAVYSGGLSQETWYHAAMVVTGAQIYQYMDGSLIGSIGITNNSIIAVPTVTPTLVIGRYAGHYWNGQIGYVRMYNRVLSPAEISRNYKAMKIRTETSADYTETFTPTCSGEKGKVELLVVGSGANGGADVGGGGGGAQVVHNPSFTVTSGTSITATVGGIRVGDQSSGTNVHGANGRSSVFSTITALGGNGGSGRTGTKSTAGMHGGGASYNIAAVTSPDGGGNAGGAANTQGTGNCGCGGGGGAGGVGEAGTTSVKGGSGGPGVVHDISGEQVSYGAGGGGSYYNSGGYRGYGGSDTGGDGAQGSSSTSGDPGANNGRHGTGSGGGGAFSTGDYGYNGGGGGHGTIIVRYPAEEYVMEVLVVAGGGGGGACNVSDGGGSGGGGGGVLFDSSIKVLSGKNYPISVGTGGNRATADSAHGSNGVNSLFDSMIAIGGGGGGSTRDATSVPSGGSGGGAGSDSSPNTGGSGTPGQGFAGGDNSTGNTGAGGGGAGAPGTSVSAAADVPHGGAGKTFTISGTSTTYGGGGGGGKYSNGTGNPGTGGAGGGGNGGKGANGSAGTANLGGGGGGGGMISGNSSKEGGDGGEGTVIIAYKGPQRAEGGTVSTTARPGYTTHTFTAHGEDTFIA